MAERYKPMYQPWNEEEFTSDERVLAMNNVQRWIYRTLLQKAFFCSTRPNLPADDGRLWMLAGCATRAQWEENKDIVLECFTVDTVDGVQQLRQKRLVSDWDRIQAKRDKMVKLGQLGGQTKADNRQADAYRTLDDSQAPVYQVSEVSKVSKKEKEETAATAPVSSKDQGNALKEGQPGYYAEGQWSFLKTPQKVFDRMRTVWQDVVGKAAQFRKPQGKGWEWFTDTVEQFSADILIPAFEIWVDQRGKFSTDSDSPVMEFLKDDAPGWIKQVLPLNTFDGGKYVAPVISPELEAQQLEEHKKQWNITLPELEQRLQEEIATLEMFRGGLSPEMITDAESTIKSLREDIEQEKAYLAGRK